MQNSIYKVIAKHIKSEFEYNYQPNETQNNDYNFYWTMMNPGTDINHHTDYHEDVPAEPIDKVVDRDTYPAETGGQGELDTVDYWLDGGAGYFILEPAFDTGTHETYPWNYYENYLNT